MTTRAESSIDAILNFIQKREFKNRALSSHLLVSATREYENIRQLMKLSERQRIGYIESLLRAADYNKWMEAEGMLDAAMAEFHRYLVPYIDELKRQNSSRDHRGSWKKALIQRPKSDLPIRPGFNQMNLNSEKPQRPNSEKRHLLHSSQSSRSSLNGTPRSGRNNEAQTTAERLAERFLNIYRYEWREAYDELSPRGRQKSVTDDKKIIDFLFQIAQDAYHLHCKRLAEKQISNLENEIEKVMSYGFARKFVASEDDREFLIDYRKYNAAMSVKAVIDTFNQGPLKEIQQRLRMTGGRAVQKFAAACTETSWWMCVQDPPIILDEPKDLKFDAEIYEPYDKPGTAVEFYVWPAILRGDKQGPLLSRGVAQCR